MGLIQNGNALGFSGKYFGAVAQMGLPRGLPRVLNNAIAFGPITSIPQGYNGTRGLRMTVKAGGNISAKASAEGFLSADLGGRGSLSASVGGEADMSANGNVGLNGYATFDGEADMAAAASAIGSMSARMDPLTRPSAFDIVAEVWGASRAGFSPGTMGRTLDDAEKAAKLAATLSA